MFSYYYKLSSGPTDADTPMHVMGGFASLADALHEALEHSRLRSVNYRFCYIRDDHRVLVVMDERGFQVWLNRQLSLKGEVA